MGSILLPLINSGGTQLISKTALSGSSTVISSVPQQYTHLLMVFNELYGSSDGASLIIRYNGDSSAIYSRNGVEVTTTVAASQNISDTSHLLNLITNQTTARFKTSGFAQLFNYSESIPHYTFSQSRGNNSAAPSGRIMGSSYESATPITSITIALSAGTFSGGNIYLYGVK